MNEKILFVEEGRPTLSGGFGGSFYSMLETIELLQKNTNYKFSILTYYEVPDIYKLVDIDEVEYNFLIPFQTFVNTISNTSSDKSSNIKIPFFIKTDLAMYASLGRVKSYLKIIKKVNPTIIWGNNMTSGNFAVLLSSIITKVPYIQHQRAKLSVVSFNYFISSLFSEQIIPITYYVQSTLLKNKVLSFMFKKKHTVVYNFNQNFMQPKVFKEEVLNEIRFIFMGRLIPQKKIEEFLILLYEINKTNFTKPISAKVYGDWEDQNYRNTIVEQAKQLGLENIVTFNPFSKKEEIFIDNNLNFLFHTTRKETPEPFGRVLLDAIYYGAIVVTNGLGGAGEVITDEENGTVYDINNVYKLIKKIKLYDENHTDYFLDLNKYYTKTKLEFSGENQLKKLINIIDHIL